jgi:hypothetical protein
VPGAQIIGVPAISDSDRPRPLLFSNSTRLLEVPRLSIRRGGMGWGLGVVAAG